MKTASLTCLLLTGVLLTGCVQTRSISNAGYREPDSGFHFARPSRGGDFNYRGELSEFDVLGITRGASASETEIQSALDNAKSVELQRNSSILLIQSGAMFPDVAMVGELNKHFRVNPFSGVPSAPGAKNANGITPDPESLARSLRLAAARGGNDVIVCYWGILESGNEHLATKTVSWVPVVNWFVPDEKQLMRIRLKVAVIDVRSGNWRVISPESFDDSRITVSPRRGAVDQRQVESLKAKAYEAAANALAGRIPEI
jgi:hypothetical protein